MLSTSTAKSIYVRTLYVCMLLLYRVIDLGVMTPCDKILKTAIEEKAGENLLRILFCMMGGRWLWCSGGGEVSEFLFYFSH